MKNAALAEAIARRAHASHEYDGGTYADKHLAQVARRLPALDDYQAVAWLHDIVEDTPWTVTQLDTLFPERIVTAVAMLTRTGSSGFQEYMVYVNSIAHAAMRGVEGAVLARAVKIADLEANLAASWDPGASALTPEHRQKCRLRWAAALALLRESNALEGEEVS